MAAAQALAVGVGSVKCKTLLLRWSMLATSYLSVGGSRQHTAALAGLACRPEVKPIRLSHAASWMIRRTRFGRSPKIFLAPVEVVLLHKR